MTVMTKEFIRERIKIAIPSSPIAVFAIDKDHPNYKDRYNTFNAFFASTVISTKLIACAKQGLGNKLIGVYTNGSVRWFDADIFELEAHVLLTSYVMFVLFACAIREVEKMAESRVWVVLKD